MTDLLLQLRLDSGDHDDGLAAEGDVAPVLLGHGVVQGLPLELLCARERGAGLDPDVVGTPHVGRGDAGRRLGGADELGLEPVRVERRAADGQGRRRDRHGRDAGDGERDGEDDRGGGHAAAALAGAADPAPGDDPEHDADRRHEERQYQRERGRGLRAR